VNGSVVDRWEMIGSGDLHEVALPSEALVAGTNEIAFRYRWSRAPAEMATGSTDVRRLAVQWIHLDVVGSRPGTEGAPRVPSPDPESGGLWLPAASRTVFHIDAPAEAWLEIAAREGAGRVEVVVERRRGEPVAAPALVPDALAEPSEIALADRSGDIARITLSTLGLGPEAPGPVRVEARVHRRLTASEVRTANETGAAGDPGSSRESGPPGARPPNVVLYVTDTLRADRLGLYGYPRPTSPHLDAFAESAVVFDRGLAQAPYTRPSTASIVTGLSPATHRVLGLADVLPPEAPTLATLLHGAGYETAAFVANGNVIEDFGFGAGYDRFEDLTGPVRTRARGFELHAAHADHAQHEFLAPLNEYVFEWLEQRDADRPFLLYVHAVEPHSPYTPPEPFRSRFAPDVGRDDASLDPETLAIVRRLQASFVEQGVPQARRGIGSRAWLHALAAGAIEPTERVLADLNALYDAEVAFADAAFGALMDELRRREAFEDSVILFVSDHGEEFFEHGSWEHGKTLHAEVLRVPMILRLPGGSPGGIRLRGAARHIDLLPTLLDAAGLAPPVGLEGRSLMGAVRGRDLDDAPSFAFVDLNGHVGGSIEDAEWKLIEALRPVARTSLFARSDPEEQRNLAASDPILAGWMAARLRSESARGRARRLETKRTAIDPELEAQLRAMGYVE
jgi:arylsulfatase A-like enzyme